MHSNIMYASIDALMDMDIYGYLFISYERRYIRTNEGACEGKCYVHTDIFARNSLPPRSA